MQLLGRNGENLLHFGKHPLVAAFRQFLIEGLQCKLLALGFGQAGLQLRNADPGFAHGLLRLARSRARIAGVRIGLAKLAGKFAAQILHVAPHVHPEPRQRQCDKHPHTDQPTGRKGGISNRHGFGAIHIVTHERVLRTSAGRIERGGGGS